MAHAGVKNMLKQFEQGDNMSAGRGRKPGLAAKPVLQRFQQVKENAESPNSTDLPPKPALKPGHGHAGVKLAGLADSDVVLKPHSNSSNVGNSGNDTSDKRRVSVPKIFQNGQAFGANNDDNNNNNNNNNNGKTNGVLTETSTSSNSNKPPLVPKFPKPSVSNQEKPAAWSKHENTTKPSDKFNSRPAIVPKNIHAKSDSPSSSISSSSNQNTDITSVSPTPTSSSTPPQSQETNGAFDFKSMLRKADSSGTPGKRVLSGVNSNSSSESATPKSPVFNSSSTTVTSSICTEKSNVPSSVPPIPTGSAVQLRLKQDQCSEEIVERKSDGKKFRKIALPSHSSNAAPQKPTAPSDLDLTSIREEFKKAKNDSQIISSNFGTIPETAEEEEDDDNLYWEGESALTTSPARLPNPNSGPPPPPPKPVETSRESARISLIPDMSAEEEGIDMPVYDVTPMECDDIYNDAISEREDLDKKKMSVSSEPQSPTESDQDRKKRQKEEALAKKKEEKEKKEKERKEKEEEKKKKKKEEEELRLRSKFNLTGQEKTVGEGVIKQDAKASGLNLKVKKGQIVTIIRLHSNPPNKWLVKTDTQVGYVDSQNIEVDPNIIRQAMTSQSEEEFDQPTYDDVPENNGPLTSLPEDDEEDTDSIYELCS